MKMTENLDDIQGEYKAYKSDRGRPLNIAVGAEDIKEDTEVYITSVQKIYDSLVTERKWKGLITILVGRVPELKVFPNGIWNIVAVTREDGGYYVDINEHLSQKRILQEDIGEFINQVSSLARLELHFVKGYTVL